MGASRKADGPALDRPRDREGRLDADRGVRRPAARSLHPARAGRDQRARQRAFP
jgi:hypothetical protein